MGQPFSVPVIGEVGMSSDLHEIASLVAICVADLEASEPSPGGPGELLYADDCFDSGQHWDTSMSVSASASMDGCLLEILTGKDTGIYYMPILGRVSSCVMDEVPHV